jgi:hypothetical protein
VTGEHPYHTLVRRYLELAHSRYGSADSSDAAWDLKREALVGEMDAAWARMTRQERWHAEHVFMRKLYEGLTDG